MSIRLANFIDNFFEDFSGEIPDDVLFKLLIVKYIDNEKKRDEICKEIKMQQKNGFLIHMKKKNPESIKRAISRIKKNCDKIYKLPYLIHIKKLVSIIIKKYSQPSYIGLPFTYWNEDNMKKFIDYYFKFPNEIRISDKIKYETLQKYINPEIFTN